MGRLSDDMTRLSDEVATLHRTREASLRGVREAVSTLRAKTSEMQDRFRNAHDEMARKAKSDLSGFVSRLKGTVAGLETRFRNEHAAMAKRTKANMMASVSGVQEAVMGLRKTVAGLRRDFAEDLDGAHGAWFGVAPGKAQPKAQAEEPKEKTKKRKG